MSAGRHLARTVAWLRAHPLLIVATLLVLGLVVTMFVTTFRIYDDRRQRAEEAVSTDMAFCALANNTRSEINRNRETLRRAFALVRPAPGATLEESERLEKFRASILATINGDLALLDCSGIGNGKLDFSIQDAIADLTTTTTRGTP